MRFNKKFIVLLAFVSLFLCIVTLQDTYAKYIASADGTTDISIARWRILVNDFDIRNQLTSSNLITPTFNGTSHIAPNVIAPTASGYFEVEIDATDTDVSFNYTITVENNEDTIVDDVKILSCYMNGQPITCTNGSVTGTVGINDVSKVNTLRVNLQWTDGADQTMDNAADTLTTMDTNPVAKIDVTASFVQIASNS